MNSQNIERLKVQIDKWSAEIDVLEAQLRELEVDARQDFMASLEDLKKRREDAVGRLRAMTDEGGGLLKTACQSVYTAWQDMVGSIKSTKNAFRGMM